MADKKERPETEAQEWFVQIDESLSRERKWRKKGESIVERYRNEQRISDSESLYNVLYSNTETLAPMLFSRVPEPVIRRRNTTSKAARDVSELLERAIGYTNDEKKVEEVFDSVVEDYQLPGRAQTRIKLENVFEEVETKTVVEGVIVSEEELDEETGEILASAVFEQPEGAEQDEETGEFFTTEKEEELVFQEISINYHAWDEWTHGEATKWKKVPWIDYIVMMNKADFEAEFGKNLAAKIPFTAKIKKSTRNQLAPQEPMAEVHEIWDKRKRERFFLVRGHDQFFDSDGEEGNKDDDPLGLDGFFPSPAPLLSISTNNTLIPVPFFLEYQDQANQLDSLTTRIAVLTDNLRYRGVYDAGLPQLQQLNNALDGQFIPIEDYAKFADKGGLAQVFDTLDIVEMTNTIVSLEAARASLLQVIFEIIGISDIMRGKTDPNEAAETNRIKGNYGTIRISKQQRQVQAFIRDTYELLGEALIENVDPAILEIMTGVPVTPEMEELMVNQKPRAFWVDIETDSTIVEDEVAEQQQSQEMIAAIASFGEVLPLLLNTIGEEGAKAVFFKAFSTFRQGRQLEDIIEASIADLKEQREAQSQQQPPDPELIKAQTAQQKLQLEAQELQVESQIKIAELELAQQKLQLEATKAGGQQQSDQFSNALDAARLELDNKKLALEAINPNKNIVREG